MCPEFKQEAEKLRIDSLHFSPSRTCKMDKTLQMSHFKEVSVLSNSPNMSMNPDQPETSNQASLQNNNFGANEVPNAEHNRFRFLDNFYYFRSVLGIVLLTHQTNFQFFMKIKPGLIEMVNVI